MVSIHHNAIIPSLQPILSHSPTMYEPLSMGSPKTKWKYHYFPLTGHGDIDCQSIFSVSMDLSVHYFAFLFQSSKGNVPVIFIFNFQRSDIQNKIYILKYEDYKSYIYKSKLVHIYRFFKLILSFFQYSNWCIKN